MVRSVCMLACFCSFRAVGIWLTCVVTTSPPVSDYAASGCVVLVAYCSPWFGVCLPAAPVQKSINTTRVLFSKSPTGALLIVFFSPGVKVNVNVNVKIGPKDALLGDGLAIQYRTAEKSQTQ